MFYDTEKNDHGLPYNPFKAIVVPRPIAWISTRSRDGACNLAPYSFFNAVGYYPPLVAFASGGRPPKGEVKHSMRNVLETREFVVNIVPYALIDAMNRTAEEVEEGIDEYKHADLETAECRIVNVPRIKASPIALECQLIESIPLPGRGVEAEARLAVGHVVGIHIDDDVITDEGRVDILKIQPVARLGYMDYTSIKEIFTMYKPLSDDHSGKINQDYLELKKKIP